MFLQHYCDLYLCPMAGIVEILDLLIFAFEKLIQHLLSSIHFCIWDWIILVTWSLLMRMVVKLGQCKICIALEQRTELGRGHLVKGAALSGRAAVLCFTAAKSNDGYHILKLITKQNCICISQIKKRICKSFCLTHFEQWELTFNFFFLQLQGLET